MPTQRDKQQSNKGPCRSALKWVAKRLCDSWTGQCPLDNRLRAKQTIIKDNATASTLKLLLAGLIPNGGRHQAQAASALAVSYIDQQVSFPVSALPVTVLVELLRLHSSKYNKANSFVRDLNWKRHMSEFTSPNNFEDFPNICRNFLKTWNPPSTSRTFKVQQYYTCIPWVISNPLPHRHVNSHAANRLLHNNDCTAWHKRLPTRRHSRDTS